MTPQAPPLDCAAVLRRLDDLASGELDAAAAAELDAHLVACATCRAEAAALRRVLAEAAALPRDVAPARDLWPGIAGRLEVRPPVSLPRRRPAFLALAATLLMALGGLATHFLVEPRLAEPGGIGAASGDGAPADVRLASSGAPGDALAGVELEVLRAKETLWRSAYRGRDDLSPETLAVLERNLRVIDEAIGELRTALAADPGNPGLTHLLLASHRREIDLLQHLARRPAEV